MKKNNINRQYSLMVVDNRTEVGEFLYDFFNSKGYEVFKASDGEAAVRIIDRERPEILLLDIELKGKITGVKILRSVKKNLPGTKVIVMTGNPDKKAIGEMFSLGAEECIQKPFSLNYLEQVVMLKVMKFENENLSR